MSVPDQSQSMLTHNYDPANLSEILYVHGSID